MLLGTSAPVRVVSTKLAEGQTPQLRPADDNLLWPDGVVGSITHTRGLCGVAVARFGGTVLGLGSDVEPDAGLPERIAQRVLTPDEQRRLAAEPDPSTRARLATIAFSLKEAVFKCLQPISNHGLTFADVELLDTNDPTATEVRPGPELARRIPLHAELVCHYQRAGGFVLCGAMVRRRGSSQS